ncbi:MAG: NHL repeat-containing protein [Candidatus Firestonebacteria bacterium]|nr:NHL repeat-containing protein [Candidatus Firestonebacteria bacterium]
MKRIKSKWIIVSIIGILFAVSSLKEISAAEKVKMTVSSRKVKLVKRIHGKDVGGPQNFKNTFVINIDRERSVLYVGEAEGPIFRFDIRDNFKFLDVLADGVRIKYLLDINLDRNGNIFVLDGRLNLIYVFDNQGTLKQTIKPRDSRAPGTQLGIVSLAFSSKGDMYVGDKGGNGIQVLDWEGNYLYQIKKAHLDQLDFGFPSISSIRVNSQDEIYLFDNLISRIIKFNLKGKTLAVFGGRGDVAGKFMDATDMTIDNKDRVYVIESMTGTVQVFDKDGNFLHILVDENGERLILINPSRIVLDETGRLVFVMERFQGRVSIFQFVD